MVDPTHDLTVVEIGGQRALVVQPTISDDAPPATKNALAIRRQANTTGTCPECGATFDRPNREARRKARRAGDVVHMWMRHENHCPVLLDGES